MKKGKRTFPDEGESTNSRGVPRVDHTDRTVGPFHFTDGSVTVGLSCLQLDSLEQLRKLRFQPLEGRLMPLVL